MSIFQYINAKKPVTLPRNETAYLKPYSLYDLYINTQMLQSLANAYNSTSFDLISHITIEQTLTWEERASTNNKYLSNKAILQLTFITVQ